MHVRVVLNLLITEKEGHLESIIYFKCNPNTFSPETYDGVHKYEHLKVDIIRQCLHHFSLLYASNLESEHWYH